MGEYNVDAYGMWKIGRMLARYAEGEDTATVLSLELHRTPHGFGKDWLRRLKKWVWCPEWR